MAGEALIKTYSPTLSIVVVNYNGTEDTLCCLASIYQYPPQVSFEVICVDNCSEKPFLPHAQEAFPQVRYYQSPQRQGFSKNYNLGARQARGELILILNNDTVVHPGALDAMLESLQSNPAYGMVGPRLLQVDGRIQTVCVRSLYTPVYYVLIQFLLDLALPSGKLWDQYQRWRLQHRSSGPVPCISGACMLVSRTAVENVGLLDEGYDFYYEDIEWCHRFQKEGYQVAYIAEAQITHLGDHSLSKVKEWAKQSEYRSALRYFRQYHHLSKAGAWGIWLATAAGFCFRAVLFSLAEIITAKKSYGQAYRNLIRWILRHPPGNEN
jgi:N-acetylglucosaminyl-diphospho-decaprenol L-rhamnosyltransferase